MLQSQMSSREGRRQSAPLFTLQDHVLFDHACHLAISQLDGLFSPPKRDMGKALNEAADQLVRNAAQGPVPLPTAGRAAACHEHSCHLEVSTLSQPHGDRKNAGGLPCIRKCAAHANYFGRCPCRNAPRLLLIQIEQEKAQRHNAPEGERHRLPIDVLAAELPVTMIAVV